MKKSSRKIWAAAIATAIAVSTLAIQSFAATKNITGFSGERSLSDNFVLGQSGSPFYSGSSNNQFELEVVPGEEVRIPLTADMFEWGNGKEPLPMEAISVRDLTSNKVQVRASRYSGGMALDYIQFDTDTFAGKPFHPSGALYPMTGRTACISIMFAEEYVSVKDLDFNFDVYLIVDGVQSEDMKITLYGTMHNDEIDINADTDYVDLSDKSVAVAEDGNSSVKVNAGNGVSIERWTVKGKKYYATSEVKPTTDPTFEEEYGEVYPAVKMVYKMNTVNMRYGRSNVTIKTDDDKVYYVYNDKMEYLGKSDETLYYSDYYFMSTEEIPSFEQQDYVNSLTNLPASLQALYAYDTGEDSETEYLQAEAGIATTSGSKGAEQVKGNVVSTEFPDIRFHDSNGVDTDFNLELKRYWEEQKQTSSSSAPTSSSSEEEIDTAPAN